MEKITQSVSIENESFETKEDVILAENNLKSGNSSSKKFTKKPPFNQQNKMQKVSVTGYEEKVVGVKRISKTTKGGRNMRFSALVVIGDKKGLVGFGMGKSIEVPVAIKKALKNAKNNMFKIKMNKNFTLFHETIGKYGAGRVMLKPAKEGTGIIAGGPIRVVLELAGFKDVYSKNLGKNTSINMIRATLEGLLSQKTPKEISFLRDKDLKDL
ncbi:MAG: 30S ribosomal protein S5 [Bacilli bacterium]